MVDMGTVNEIFSFMVGTDTLNEFFLNLFIAVFHLRLLRTVHVQRLVSGVRRLAVNVSL